MNYRTKIRREALRELKSLPGHGRAEARKMIGGLGSNPRPSWAQELRGKPDIFRIWLAEHWRLVYAIEEGCLVRILRIRRKDNIDYESLPSE